MLSILEINDPTLRLQCKSWLQESTMHFNKILDPLIQDFLRDSNVLVSFSGQVFFLEEYNADLVISNFGKLRNIILNAKEEII